jgi:hypothetical protein
MAGLVPAIHVFGSLCRWMPATSAGMTGEALTAGHRLAIWLA